MRRITLTRALSALTLVATLAAAAAAPHAARAAHAETAPAYGRCPFPMPQGEIDGVTIQCGTLTVPQNRAKPLDTEVKLPFAILRSFQRKPLPDAVIHLHGGPGGSSLLFADEGVRVFEPLRETRDVVLFDQRGSGLARPGLNCFDVEFDPDSVPAVVVPAGFDQRRARTLLACADALEAQGVDLTQYNTAVNAQDVLDLVEALGLEQFNLTGVSYGTRLAQEVMRLRPAGLRSVVLDSALSPATKSYEEFYTKGWSAIENVFEDCARDASCNKAHPNLRARALRLLEQLDRSPARVQQDGLDFMLDGYTLMKPILYAGDAPDAAPYLPRLFAEVAQGEYDTLLAIEAGEIDRLLPQSSAELAVLDPSTPAEAFDAAVRARLDALGDTDAAEDARAAWFGALGELKGRAALRDVVTAHFADDAQQLLSLLAVLSDADLEDLYRANRIQRGSSRELGAFKAFECHDSYPFNDPGKVAANAEMLPFRIPNDVLKETSTTMQECQLWPTGVGDPRIIQPVTSTAPVLVLQGRYDFVTPPAWGRALAAQLPNATYAEIGLSGHGTMKYSQCARDLAAAFIADPARTLDLSCAAAIRPVWK
jgi:pimeloyl-ACP methyl ester carboxylesterase